MAKKKFIGEDGKEYVAKVKKPFYKRVWFWILVVIVVIGVGGALGGEDKKETTSTLSSTNNSSAETKSSDTESESTDSALKDDFDKIQLGDILSNGDGGTSLEDVKAIFGEPGSTSETNIEGQTAKTLTWSGLKGGSILSSLVVSFSNDKAVSKAIMGLKVPKHEKITLDQFNAVNTDGSYTEDQAKQEFGDPSGISTTIINGQTQNMLSWTDNINGDLGANFNITFDDGKATNKSQFQMK